MELVDCMTAEHGNEHEHFNSWAIRFAVNVNVMVA